MRMTRLIRPQGGTSSNGMLGLLAVAGMILVTCGAWLPVLAAGPPGDTTGGPIVVAINLATGAITWTQACTIWLLVEVLTVLALAATTWWLRNRRRPRQLRGDRAVRSMARPRDLAHLTGPKAATTARRLQPHLVDKKTLDAGDLGPVLVRDLRSGSRLLHASLEDTVTIITGPRRGKTLCVVIPALVAHRGPALATGNKRDIVDDTCDVRAILGAVWVFDPQAIASDDQGFWFDPLAGAADIRVAQEIAGIFASAQRDPGAKTDAHFDNAARNLITCLIVAAAAGNLSLIDVYTWAANPDQAGRAVAILETAARSSKDSQYTEMATNLAGELAAFRAEPDKMRGSTFGSARTMLACLANPAYTRWIRPRDNLRRFDPTAFATSTDTLYLITQGGPSSPAPLVALLVADVMRAARARATRSTNGRLTPAMLICLDEAANICRLPELPQWFSFFGSQGLPLLLVLQSYSQGESVWGRLGMDAMFDEASHILYLGGLKDPRYLTKISELIGDHDVSVASRSTTPRQGTTTSVQTRRERIMSVADLAALPLGRAILIPSGAPAVLGATVPWYDGPHAQAVQASHDHNTPTGEF